VLSELDRSRFNALTSLALVYMQFDQSDYLGYTEVRMKFLFSAFTAKIGASGNSQLGLHRVTA
jgi:hypothetical protein